jgi:hypothetical protein
MDRHQQRHGYGQTQKPTAGGEHRQLLMVEHENLVAQRGLAGFAPQNHSQASRLPEICSCP